MWPSSFALTTLWRSKNTVCDVFVSITLLFPAQIFSIPSLCLRYLPCMHIVYFFPSSVEVLTFFRFVHKFVFRVYTKLVVSMAYMHFLLNSFVLNQGKRNYRKLAPQQSFRKTSSDVKSHLEVINKLFNFETLCALQWSYWLSHFSCASVALQLSLPCSSATPLLLFSCAFAALQLRLCCSSAVPLLLFSCSSVALQPRLLLFSCVSVALQLRLCCSSALCQLRLCCSSAASLLNISCVSVALQLCSVALQLRLSWSSAAPLLLFSWATALSAAPLLLFCCASAALLLRLSLYSSTVPLLSAATRLLFICTSLAFQQRLCYSSASLLPFSCTSVALQLCLFWAFSWPVVLGKIRVACVAHLLRLCQASASLMWLRWRLCCTVVGPEICRSALLFQCCGSGIYDEFWLLGPDLG